MIVGIGGVGSWVAEALARSGTGELTLVDMDHVAESNVNRQIHAIESTFGQAKILAMKDRIALINPNCVVHVVDDFVTPENWVDMVELAHSSSVSPNKLMAVVDACDQVKAKVAMAGRTSSKARSLKPESQVPVMATEMNQSGNERCGLATTFFN
jgi:tRNA A37 threonylcarbamoyladenosine dehydratase